ncbi:hypothetical protein TNCV_1919411 [Trichonephila clavipes]|nr:hypothetical protein TNCV_1919411 [Trichonephila clavipes]
MKQTIAERSRISCWFNDEKSIKVRGMTHAQSAKEKIGVGDRRARSYSNHHSGLTQLGTEVKCSKADDSYTRKGGFIY